METILTILSSLVIGYIFGAIPFGLLLTKLAGYGDIRAIGSGNIGATNVLRTGNKKLAALTLLLDAGKGAFAIGAGFLILGPIPPDFIALGAVLGHCYPVWLNFKGGKGVATTIGTLLAAFPLAGLAAVITWLFVAKRWKISSLAALSAMAVAPLVALIAYGLQAGFVCALISALVFHRHQENIARLRAGTEPKIGDKKEASDAATAD